MAAMLDRFTLDYEGENTRYPQDQFGVAKLALKNGDIEHGVEIMNRLLLTAPLEIQCEAAILLAKRKQRTESDATRRRAVFIPAEVRAHARTAAGFVAVFTRAELVLVAPERGEAAEGE